MSITANITGKSKHVQALRKRLDRLSRSGDSILLVGEPGVGKSRIAAALGSLAPSSATINPAGLTEEELRSILDGCDVQTLVVEELEESSLRAQEILSCFMSRRAGQVRLIVTLRSTPDVLLEKRKLLDELYGKVLGFERVDIQPLRERPEDIPLLLREFASGLVIDVNGLEVLIRQNWIGNIRELRSTVAACVAASGDARLRLPEAMVQEQQEFGKVLGGFLAGRGPHVESSLDSLEQSVLRHALDRCGNDLARVAAMLGIAPAVLELRLAKLGISSESSAA